MGVRSLRPGPRRGIGLSVYVEKTGLGPFETAHLEARPDGRFTVDTGASSMGPGLETVLAQILGETLGLAADRFEVRHADTSHVESGVGTYGSRGTVTAGNAAAMAAAKLIGEARSRAAASWGVPESEVSYASGALEAAGRRVTLGELAALRGLAVGASFNVPKITYAGCAVGVIADVDVETGTVHLVAGNGQVKVVGQCQSYRIIEGQHDLAFAQQIIDLGRIRQCRLRNMTRPVRRDDVGEKRRRLGIIHPCRRRQRFWFRG